MIAKRAILARGKEDSYKRNKWGEMRFALNQCSITYSILFLDIFRKYNEKIYGFSTGTGSASDSNSKLNVAVPGAKSQ